jgi:hypothetical protein
MSLTVGVLQEYSAVAPAESGVLGSWLQADPPEPGGQRKGKQSCEDVH